MIISRILSDFFEGCVTMYICICNGITDRDIRQCAQSGLCSMSDLECRLGVGVSCGRCREAAGEILNEARLAAQPPAMPGGAARRNVTAVAA